MNNCLYVVIPCCNKEAVLPKTAKRMNDKMHALIKAGRISPLSKVVFINDGSRDKTWEVITTLYEHNTLFSGLSFSRSNGHQNALMAGFMTVKEHADMVISIDADLQVDIDAIDRMVDRYLDGCDIVYGVHSRQAAGTFFKRFAVEGFCRLMNALGVETAFNRADFRLMSRQVLFALAEFKEVNLFLNRIVPMAGFKYDIVLYDKKERSAAKKHPLKKKLAFKSERTFSASLKPIRMITGLGIGVFFISIIMLIYLIICRFSDRTVDDWASLAVSVWAIGGLLLISVGIVGEYIGRIYLETKNRPRHVVECFLNKKDEKTETKK